MDISKASNFERFVYDLVDQAAGVVAELWRRVDEEGGFDLVGTPYLAKLPEFGFVSGRSTHADRLATIRDVRQRYGVLIDTHTADGIKVAREFREPATPMICLETAQPVKFAEAIRAATGRDPDVPSGYEGLERLPQRVEIMDPGVDAVKAFIARHASD
jgi:threonine synthase